MPVKISSLGNDCIKRVIKLKNRRFRDSQQQTVVEGSREVARALAAGIQPVEAYICPPLLKDLLAQETARTLLEQAQTTPLKIFEVTPPVFQKMAYREESGGLLIVISYLAHNLENLALGNPPFLAIIEGVEKPGNLGGILRTADAAGVDGVIVCSSPNQTTTDIYNPNAIRASLGALFTVPTMMAENGRLRDWLTQHNIRVVAATPTAAILYTATDMTGATAVVMGSEAAGLSDFWLQSAQEHVSIPMAGMVDSLNLSVATALLLYEVVRQRDTAQRQQLQ
ncbi:MAG: RNA methyltransferase [Chloroflexota bacterium]